MRNRMSRRRECSGGGGERAPEKQFARAPGIDQHADRHLHGDVKIKVKRGQVPRALRAETEIAHQFRGHHGGGDSLIEACEIKQRRDSPHHPRSPCDAVRRRRLLGRRLPASPADSFAPPGRSVVEALRKSGIRYVAVQWLARQPLENHSRAATRRSSRCPSGSPSIRGGRPGPRSRCCPSRRAHRDSRLGRLATLERVDSRIERRHYVGQTLSRACCGSARRRHCRRVRRRRRVNMRFTCTGLAYPAVSERPTDPRPHPPDPPPCASPSLRRPTPSIEHPNAVEIPTSTEGRDSGGIVRHNSHAFRTCSIASSGVMRIFDMLCARDAETGKFNL